jgi:hypothetical protein
MLHKGRLTGSSLIGVGAVDAQWRVSANVCANDFEFTQSIQEKKVRGSDFEFYTVDTREISALVKSSINKQYMRDTVDHHIKT